MQNQLVVFTSMHVVIKMLVNFTVILVNVTDFFTGVDKK